MLIIKKIVRQKTLHSIIAKAKDPEKTFDIIIRDKIINSSRIMTPVVNQVFQKAVKLRHVSVKQSITTLIDVNHVFFGHAFAHLSVNFN